MADTLYNQVDGLFKEGHLKQNEDGDLVPIDDPEERNSIQNSVGSKHQAKTDQITSNRREAQVFGMNQLELEEDVDI